MEREVGSGITVPVWPAKFRGLFVALFVEPPQIREAVPLVGSAVYAPLLVPKNEINPPAVNKKLLGMMKSGAGPPAACSPAVPNKKDLLDELLGKFEGSVNVLVSVLPTLETEIC